jgi:chorismate mutase
VTDGGSGPNDAARSADEARLDELRSRIRALDQDLVALVGERRAVALEIGALKERLGLPVLDPAQEARVVRRASELAREAGVDPEAVRDIVWRIMASARDAQEKRTRWGPPTPGGSGSSSDSG